MSDFAATCRRGGFRVLGDERCDCGERAFFFCDSALKARKGWRPCGKPLCVDHASFRGAGFHYCPLHAKRRDGAARNGKIQEVTTT